MISDRERREVVEELCNVFAPYGVPKGRYISLPDVLDAVGIHYDEDVDVDAVTDVKDVSRLIDLINRPTCCDLVEHKQDPFVPGKRMTDGFFHCSACGWHGRIYEYIGFGDMAAYEAVHCPKCGKEIERW